MKTAGIVGSGIAGIALAIRLANKGYKVSIFETNTYPGGKLSEINCNGYRFDAGPSLFTLPEQVDDLFRLSGYNPKDFFQYIRLPVTCKYFYEDGTIINAYAEQNDFIEELHRKTGTPKEAIKKAIKNSSMLYKLLSDLFMYRSLHNWKTYVNPNAFRAYLNLPKFDFFRTMHGANQAMLQNDKAVQLFNRYATYNGSDPYQAPATLNIIPHLEMGIGAFFPTKGMHSITSSLYELAKKLGVTFHFNNPVEKIIVKENKAMGLKLKEEFYYFDKVISNADISATYKKLLPDQKQPKELLNQPKSSSALIFYWGIKNTFQQLDLHNIFFSSDYRAEFDHIFRKKTVYSDPTVYINITSKHKPDDAPEGCENWFTMVNVPNNTGQNWDELINQTRKNILKKISRLLHTDINGVIECEEVLDPRLIESKTSSSLGALYGNSSNNKYAAFLRHANKSSQIKNLYFCGGSVHPGGGIPLCLLSAKITASLIE